MSMQAQLISESHFLEKLGIKDLFPAQKSIVRLELELSAQTLEHLIGKGDHTGTYLQSYFSSWDLSFADGSIQSLLFYGISQLQSIILHYGFLVHHSIAR